MTENEAIAVRFIENIKNHAMVTPDHITKEEHNVSPLVYKGREEKADTILAMVEEVMQYRAVGTPEECRAAVEKQTAKKPKKAVVEGYRFTDTYKCPNCGGNFSGTGIADYCYHCGQKLDWSDEE